MQIFSLIKDIKLSFSITIGLNKIRRDVFLLDFSEKEKKILINTGEVFKVQDINEITFTGKDAIKFFKELKPNLPEYDSPINKHFTGKSIFIYPFGKKGYIKANFVKEYQHFFILHTKQKRGRLIRHSYQIKYKIFISAHSFIDPYPSNS
jgi:hypothetical protein